MKLLALATVLVSFSLPLSVHADATGNARLSDFRYELIDLDLNDGIAAQVTLTDGGRTVMAGYYANGADNTPPYPFEYLSTEGTVDLTVAAGTTTGTLGTNSASTSVWLHGRQGSLFAEALSASSFKQLLMKGNIIKWMGTRSFGASRSSCLMQRQLKSISAQWKKNLAAHMMRKPTVALPTLGTFFALVAWPYLKNH